MADNRKSLDLLIRLLADTAGEKEVRAALDRVTAADTSRTQAQQKATESTAKGREETVKSAQELGRFQNAIRIASVALENGLSPQSAVDATR